MSRIPAVNPDEATGKTATLLANVRTKLGFTPNLMRVLAHSPTALEAHLNCSHALAGGVLSARVREQIALAVAEINGCGYCLSAHSALGGQLGLSAEEINAARRSSATDPKTNAVLTLAQAIVVQRGEVSDADWAAARVAGLTDVELAEGIAHVALNLFTDYTNLVAHTEIDFPRVEPGVPPATEGAACTTAACAH